MLYSEFYKKCGYTYIIVYNKHFEFGPMVHATCSEAVNTVSCDSYIFANILKEIVRDKSGIFSFMISYGCHLGPPKTDLLFLQNYVYSKYQNFKWMYSVPSFYYFLLQLL